MIYLLLYVILSIGIGIYIYFDTLKDRKFRGVAMQIGFIFAVAWPVILVITVFGYFYIKENK